MDLTKGILHLPPAILSCIASYLTFDDILKFRSVCWTLYAATNCKEILRRLCLCPKRPSNAFNNFMDILDGARFVRLSLLSLKKQDFAKLLPHIANVSELQIQMQCLPLTGRSCSRLKTLMLYDKEINFLSKKTTEELEIFMEPLSQLTHLRELFVRGCKQLYTSNILIIILEKAKRMKTLRLESLIINNTKRPTELQAVFASSKHVVHWAFSNIHVTSRKGLYLPSDILSFSSIDTVFSPLNKTHSRIEKLVVHGVIPYLAKIWKQNRFVNLQRLELYHAFFYHSKLAACSKLQTIKLIHCHLPFSYLISLSACVKENLTELWIETYKEFTNERLLQLFREFRALKRVYLINMTNITPQFLPEIGNTNSDGSPTTLEQITLRNCQHFKNTKAVNAVKMMQEACLSFNVVLDQCISCSVFY